MKHYRRFRRSGSLDGAPTGSALFWQKVTKTPYCWEWHGHKNAKGYGRFGQVYAHRFAFTEMVGPIPEGLTLDHLCRNRACVRPNHLDVTGRGENTMRGMTVAAANASKTHCPQGHPYDAANTILRRGRRHCRECQREHSRAARDRRRLRAV